MTRGAFILSRAKLGIATSKEAHEGTFLAPFILSRAKLGIATLDD